MENSLPDYRCIPLPYKTALIILPIFPQFSLENTILDIRLAHPVILLPHSLRIVIADGMSPFSPTSQQTNKAIKTIQLQAFNIENTKSTSSNTANGKQFCWS